MSEPIKAGDLVIVTKAKTCCGDVSDIGQIFRVKKLWSYPPFHPSSCCASTPNLNRIGAQPEGEWRCVLTSRLKRIDPPAEQTDTETQRERPHEIHT